MEPSENAGEPETRRVFDEIGPLNSDPQDHPQSLEDITPGNGNVSSKRKEKTPLSREFASREDIEPSISGALAIREPLSKEGQRTRTTTTHNKSSKSDDKEGKRRSTIATRRKSSKPDDKDRGPRKQGENSNENPNEKSNENLNGNLEETLLEAARSGNINTVEFLLNAGVSCEFTDRDNRTPLLCAVEENHSEIVDLLLRRNADWNATDKWGRTALHIVSSGQGYKIALRLLNIKGIRKNAKDEQDETPLHLAVRNQHLDTAKLLLNSEAKVNEKDKKGFTPLHLAAARGVPIMVETILSSNGIEVDARAINGRTPLMLACGRAASKECEAVVKLLLHAGTDSTLKDKDGRTALLESIKYDKVEIMRLVLENLERKDGQERKELVQQALFEAAVQDSRRIARVLIKKGAIIGEKDPTSQNTAMDIANDHSSQKVVAVLLENGGQLVGQGPSMGDWLQNPQSKVETTESMLKDSAVDLTFGFQSTIASFPYDDGWGKYRIKRPQLRSVLYDHSPGPIQYDLKGGKSNSKDFRWLHVPANNIVWVNELINRMYKERHPEKASYIQEKCKYLFGEEIWTRHQYQMSSTSVAHRRFIRPTCQPVKLDYDDYDDYDMMMVLPYIHWETKGGREQMTDVMVKAMKRRLNDSQAPSTLKELKEALVELEKARKSKAIDPDYGTSSVSSSDDSSHDSYTSTISSAAEETDYETDPDTDSISGTVSENESIHARRAPVKKNVEQEKGIKKRISKIVKVAKEPRTQDEKLILAYMFDDIPLHFRRTLDQYKYYALPTTEYRDDDQVVSRYFKKTWPENDNENLVLMVDQLWLWILDKDTVVTSFPQRWNKSGKKTGKDPDPNNDSDIVESIIRQIGKKDRRPLRHVFDLAELIVGKCVDTMFQHSDIANEKLRFAEFFEVSIGNVTNEETKMFNDFKDLSKRLATDDRNILNSDGLKEDLKKLFDISKETELVKEIKDIRDELHIISTVLDDQEKVLVDMQEAIQYMKTNKSKDGWSEGGESKELRAYDLLKRVRSHKAVVQGFDKQAEKTYAALKDLLDLKQKQANVSEARTQGKQAADTARQGQTIMLFTIITVFFLPLSFMTSFFDLDIAEFVRNSEGELGLGYISKIMFAVTIGVVAISLFFAFGWELFLTYWKKFLLGTRAIAVEKLYSRRRSTSPVWEYERRSPPKGKKWSRWPWSERRTSMSSSYHSYYSYDGSASSRVIINDESSDTWSS